MSSRIPGGRSYSSIVPVIYRSVERLWRVVRLNMDECVGNAQG